MPGEKITTIVNQHIEGCGEPPQFEIDEYTHVSYFENQHGEQSLFLFDDEEEEARIYIADASWENPQVIPSKELKNMTLEEFAVISRIILGPAEKKWLSACIEAIQIYVD